MNDKITGSDNDEIMAYIHAVELVDQIMPTPTRVKQQPYEPVNPIAEWLDYQRNPLDKPPPLSELPRISWVGDWGHSAVSIQVPNTKPGDVIAASRDKYGHVAVYVNGEKRWRFSGDRAEVNALPR